VVTLTGVLVLLTAWVAFPVYFALIEPVPNADAYSRLGLAILVLPLIIAAVFVVGLIYLRTLLALARGERRILIALMGIGVLALLGGVLQDIKVAMLPGDEFPLHFLALGAWFIHVLIDFALVVGPYELIRAGDFERGVLAEPRFGVGLLLEIGKLFDFPDVGALRRKGSVRLWSLLALSLFLEGVAFNTIFKSSTNLLDAAGATLSEVGMNKGVEAGVIKVGLTILFLGLGRLFFIGARRLRVRARRKTLQSAAEVVATDPRPAVLFLRSFEKEQVTLAGARNPWLLRAFDPGAEYGTLEEMIVLGLTYVGPVVAVADPSRRDAPVGAARWRLSDDEWQRFVEAQIEGAGLIVVGVAETSGLWWEIEALKRSPGALAKTIFVCPPGTTRDRALLSKLTAVLGSSVDNPDRPALPDLDEHVLAAARLPGCIPMLFVASELSEVAYHVALRAWLEKIRQAPRSQMEQCAI
jgi:hypothetical protein